MSTRRMSEVQKDIERTIKKIKDQSPMRITQKNGYYYVYENKNLIAGFKKQSHARDFISFYL